MAAVDPADALLDQLVASGTQAIPGRAAVADGCEPALARHSAEGGSEGVAGDAELGGQPHQGADAGFFLAQGMDVVTVQREEQRSRVERRCGHP